VQSVEDAELADLLDSGELFEVLDHDHPDFPWYVSIDDDVAQERGDLIDLLVNELEERPGIRSAAREEKEIILLDGDVDGGWLQSFLESWFRARIDSP
jgi:hypothetical protein